MIVWALYDDGNGSWNKLKKENLISIGINKNDWENYKIINLSIQNENLIKELKQLPKPDLIVASPPCESWSIADNQQRLWRKQVGNHIEVFTKENVEYNNTVLPIQLKRDYFKGWRTTLNGISTAIAVAKIIEEFKPKYWIIENPQTSKIWEFFRENKLLKNEIVNVTYYNNWDSNFSKKPTNFLSNVDLKLKKEHIKSAFRWESVSGYDRRSSIPHKLIKHIYIYK